MGGRVGVWERSGLLEKTVMPELPQEAIPLWFGWVP